jgi:hypothetical protein
MIALRAGPTGARWRRMASVSLPGMAPLGSSGTLRWPQAKLLLFPHGANAISACAVVAATQMHTQAVAARTGQESPWAERRTPGI